MTLCREYEKSTWCELLVVVSNTSTKEFIQLITRLDEWSKYSCTQRRKLNKNKLWRKDARSSHIANVTLILIHRVLRLLRPTFVNRKK